MIFKRKKINWNRYPFTKQDFINAVEKTLLVMESARNSGVYLGMCHGLSKASFKKSVPMKDLIKSLVPYWSLADTSKAYWWYDDEVITLDHMEIPMDKWYRPRIRHLKRCLRIAKRS